MATIASEHSPSLLWSTARDIGMSVCGYAYTDSIGGIQLTIIGAFVTFSAVVIGYVGPGLLHKLTRTAKVRGPVRASAKLLEFAGMLLAAYGVWQLGRDYAGIAAISVASVVVFTFVWAGIVYGLPEYWRRRKLAIAAKLLDAVQAPAAQAAISPGTSRGSQRSAAAGWTAAGVAAAVMVLVAVSSRRSRRSPGS